MAHDPEKGAVRTAPSSLVESHVPPKVSKFTPSCVPGLSPDTACKQVSEIAKPGHTVLDIASGPGEPALTIAKALPQLRVFSTDCSVPMTVQATEAAAEAGVKNMEVKVADMQVRSVSGAPRF